MSKKNEWAIEQYITVGKQKYRYTLKPLSNGETHVECEAAGINQDFLDEDILNLIIDLPNLIVAEKEYEKKQEYVLRFRCNGAERRAIEKQAVQKRFPTLSAYLRALALYGEIKSPIELSPEGKERIKKVLARTAI
ncbi:MAG: hypothetical protein V1908_02975 [Candidatus Peregrinibacteria bacterium]